MVLSLGFYLVVSPLPSQHQLQPLHPAVLRHAPCLHRALSHSLHSGGYRLHRLLVLPLPLLLRLVRLRHLVFLWLEGRSFHPSRRRFQRRGPTFKIKF